MGAADILFRMRADGFRLDVAGQALRVAPASRLTDELRTELRACKTDLLALLKTRSCNTCRHLSRVKTCTEPVAAGLLPTFGITWPESSHGASCPAWRRSPADAVVAVLTAAGRGGWTDKLMHQWLADADAHPDAVLGALRTGGPKP